MHTFCQLHVHLIFSPYARKPIIHPSWENELHRYLGGTLKELDCKPLAINGMEDHVHIVSCYPPSLSVSSLMEKVKSASTNWINSKDFLKNDFAWQRGYAGYAVSKKDLSRVCMYVENQKIHHRKKTFAEEMEEIKKWLKREDVIRGQS